MLVGIVLGFLCVSVIRSIPIVKKMSDSIYRKHKACISVLSINKYFQHVIIVFPLGSWLLHLELYYLKLLLLFTGNCYKNSSSKYLSFLICKI